MNETRKKYITKFEWKCRFLRIAGVIAIIFAGLVMFFGNGAFEILFGVTGWIVCMFLIYHIIKLYDMKIMMTEHWLDESEGD